MLNSDSRFEVVGLAGNGEGAIAMAVRLRPRVVIMAINMPALNGIEATGQIRKLSPPTRVLAPSMYAPVGIALQMLMVGAMDYLTKTSPKTEMIAALLEVIKGLSVHLPGVERGIDEGRRRNGKIAACSYVA